MTKKIKLNNSVMKMLNETANIQPVRKVTFEELMDCAEKNGELAQDILDEEDDNLNDFVHSEISYDDDNEEINEDELFEDDETDTDETEKLMSDEDLKIESLKIATNIAKLMANVVPDDIIKIAERVASFIRGQQQTAQTVNNETATEEEISADDLTSSIEDDARTSDKAK